MLGGDVRFIKSTVDARYYHELYPAWSLVGMLRVGAGHIQGFGGDDVRLLDCLQPGGGYDPWLCFLRLWPS